MGESCRTEEKCKEKRMEFIKRFFFLPKSSRTLDRLSRREIDTEIFPRELHRNVFAHSSNPDKNEDTVTEGQRSPERRSFYKTVSLLYFFKFTFILFNKCT